MGGQPTYVPTQISRKTSQRYKYFVAELLLKKSPPKFFSALSHYEGRAQKGKLSH
jgi:hypothetical protein